MTQVLNAHNREWWYLHNIQLGLPTSSENRQAQLTGKI